jgi:predicted ester cyclase
MSALSLVERLHQLWNTGEVEAIPGIYAPGFVGHMPKGWGIGPYVGHEGVKSMLFRVRNAFPDWNEHVHDAIIANDKVVTRYTSSGRNTGPLDGRAPTGRRVSIDEISIYRIEGELVAEQWCLVDDLSFAKQLGLLK